MTVVLLFCLEFVRHHATEEILSRFARTLSKTLGSNQGCEEQNQCCPAASRSTAQLRVLDCTHNCSSRYLPDRAHNWRSSFLQCFARDQIPRRDDEFCRDSSAGPRTLAEFTFSRVKGRHSRVCSEPEKDSRGGHHLHTFFDAFSLPGGFWPTAARILLCPMQATGAGPLLCGR